MQSFALHLLYATIALDQELVLMASPKQGWISVPSSGIDTAGQRGMGMPPASSPHTKPLPTATLTAQSHASHASCPGNTPPPLADPSSRTHCLHGTHATQHFPALFPSLRQGRSQELTIIDGTAENTPLSHL